MKVLFVSFHNPNSIGVHKKVLQQVEFFQKSGVEIEALFINEQHEKTEKKENIHFVKPVEKPVLSSIYYRRYIRNINHYFYQNKLAAIRYKYLKKYCASITYDVIYFRYPFSSIPLAKFTKAHKNKIVFEHNTVEVNEIKGSLTKEPELKYYYFCEKYLSKQIFRNALFGLAVTQEILWHENAKAGINYCKEIYKNPIDVSKFQVRQFAPNEKSSIAILIGSYDEWHGLDILCDAIRKSKREKEYDFTYIGSVNQRVKEIFQGLEVNFTGALKQDEIKAEFEKCDITLGSLATFRFDVKELSSLKTREYMAMGVPFIIGCVDTAFMDANEQVMQYIKVIDFSKEIDLNEMDDFIQSVKNDVSHPHKLNAYAKNELDFIPTFLQIVDLMNHEFNAV